MTIRRSETGAGRVPVTRLGPPFSATSKFYLYLDYYSMGIRIKAARAGRATSGGNNGHAETNGKPKGPGPKPVFRYTDGWQERIPEEIREHDQWVLWQYELDAKGQYTKIPYRAHQANTRASSTDPQTWNPFDFTVAAYLKSQGTSRPFDGVGYVFAHGRGIVGFDCDESVSKDGEIRPWAMEIIGTLLPTYTEISPSGCGLKGFVRGELPGPGINRRKISGEHSGGFELYDAGRFFTVTGNPLDTDCLTIADRSEAVVKLYRQFAPEAEAADAPSGPPLADDDELLNRARQATNGAAFSALFDDGQFAKGSQSEADFSLCCRLAFWFNRNAEAIDRVFRRSKLMRDKWDERRGPTTYGGYTIAKAIGVTTTTYEPTGAASSSGEDDWPALRLGKLPDVEPFPLDVLPEAVAEIVLEASGAVGCDPGLAGGPALAIAAGLIGRSASLLRGPNWFASPSLFLANVALPGDGKSPCLGYLKRPVEMIDQELDDEFGREKQEYLEECKANPKSKPDPPVPRRIVLEDATLEACFRILAANPRGQLWLCDELSTLILGLNQYKRGGGNDLPNILKMWAGASIVIDRVQNEFGKPIRIAHPCISITGNLPPANLSNMVSPQGDVGFLDRWLYVYPDRRPKLKSRERRPVSNEAIQGWAQVCRNLWGRSPELRDGRSHPHVVYFSDAGKDEFDRLHDDHVDEVNASDFPDALRGPWSKLEEYAGRLCLVLALLRHAANPFADPHQLPVVEPDIARSAWRLVGYFKSHHRRVRSALEGKGHTGTPEGVRLILNWIRNHPEADAVPESELTRTYPRFRGDRAMMEDGLRWLEQRHAIRRAQQDMATGKPGRKPTPTWEIHPDLKRTDNPGNTENDREDH